MVDQSDEAAPSRPTGRNDESAAASQSLSERVEHKTIRGPLHADRKWPTRYRPVPCILYKGSQAETAAVSVRLPVPVAGRRPTGAGEEGIRGSFPNCGGTRDGYR